MTPLQISQILVALRHSERCIPQNDGIVPCQLQVKLNFFSPFTCVFIWKKYFKLKSGVLRAFGEGMKNMLLDMEKIISQFDNKRIVNFCKFRTSVARTLMARLPQLFR